MSTVTADAARADGQGAGVTAPETVPLLIRRLLRRLLHRMRDPQAGRLSAELGALSVELGSCATGDPALALARTHVAQGLQATEDGDLEAGWSHCYRARELRASAMTDVEAQAFARTLKAEIDAGDKFTAWRRTAVKELLSRVLAADGTAAEKPPGAWLREALFVLDEGYANEYRRLAILRHHQRWLLLTGTAALAGVMALLLWRPARLGATPLDARWVVVASALLGVLGAVTSAAQRSTRMPVERRIPKQIGSLSASLSRIPLGAVAGLVAWLGAHTVTTPSESTAAYALIAAFAAGFTERFVAAKQ